MADIVKYRRLKHADPQLLPTLARSAGQRRRNDAVATFWLMLLMFCVSAAVVSLAVPYLPAAQRMLETAAVPDELVSVTLPLCRNGTGDSCVIDGDTFRLDGQSYRIADIDTPEARGYACPAEKALADGATARLHQLLNAGPFELQRDGRDEDRYGRKLRIVTRDGQSLGDVLVAEGLAHRWDGGKRPWC